MTGIEQHILFIKGKNLKILLLVPVLLLIDLYVLKGLRGLSKKGKFLQKKTSVVAYWVFSASLIASLLFVNYSKSGFGPRMLLLVFFFLALLYKICFAVFIFIDDLRRYLFYFINKKNKPLPAKESLKRHPYAIPRSEFLMKAGVLAGTVPLTALGLNMKKGLYDYQVKHQTLYLPRLPKSFDGIRIGQISDIHSGNLHDKKAVTRGVEMLMREKADIVFFTGDLVDALSSEISPFFNIFNKVKAPLGVYSTLGNHDYGDYAKWWPTPALKQKNFEEIIAAHKTLGWDLLRNENRRIKVSGEEIGILGVENWSELSNIPKYGRVDLALKNTGDLPVKLLLSHDPTHWRAEILPKYPQIDVTFAGHTHGMQLGVRTNNFQWSPVEFIYHEWAGLYQQQKQQLYVNVGFGFLEVQGRVGILPEITIFELKAGTNPHLLNAVNS